MTSVCFNRDVIPYETSLRLVVALGQLRLSFTVFVASLEAFVCSWSRLLC